MKNRFEPGTSLRQHVITCPVSGSSLENASGIGIRFLEDAHDQQLFQCTENTYDDQQRNEETRAGEQNQADGDHHHHPSQLVAIGMQRVDAPVSQLADYQRKRLDHEDGEYPSQIRLDQGHLVADHIQGEGAVVDQIPQGVQARTQVALTVESARQVPIQDIGDAA